MAFIFKPLDIPDVIYVEPQVHTDERGEFSELFKQPEFSAQGISTHFVQINHSYSKKNVLRGLHYQKAPMAQAKLICVLEGEIFDAAVDLRKTSKTFGRSTTARLTADKKNMIYLPEGFAHGFYTLSEAATVLYFCTQVYSLKNEVGILWNDPALAIPWPVKNPIVSSKDRHLPVLEQALIDL